MSVADMDGDGDLDILGSYNDDAIAGTNNGSADLVDGRYRNIS